MATILIVDDRERDRELLATLLKYARHRVIEACDGAEALRLARSEQPDLMISDVLLPTVDGYELVRQIRTDPTTARIPVIFCTAVFDEQEARALARECGVARIISKPIDPERFMGIVAEVLGDESPVDISSCVPEHFELKHKQLLIDTLMQQVDALRRTRDELEQRVEERTAELAKANADLRAYASQLELMNQELQEFAFVASHDLQEPLRKVQAFGNRLQVNCGDSLDDEGRDNLMRMTKAANRMSSLLDALLIYSRITTKSSTPVPTDLTEVVRDAISDLDILIEKSEAHIELGELPTLEANPVHMRQIFQNLISNALKYRKNGERPTVKVYSEVVDDTCRIFIEDNGIGFDEQYLDRIFKPFQRLHGRSSPYEGMGMGLAICRKIVERHGGSITARSTCGKGSIFIVTLPSK